MLDVPFGKDFPRESVEELIPKFVKAGAAPNLARYHILPHQGSPHWDNRIYAETRLGLKLAWRPANAPLTIGFVGVEIRNSAIAICQLQGSRGEQEQLRPLKWERLLVHAVIEAARHTKGCTEVHMCNAGSLVYYAMPHSLTISREAHKSQLEMRYDVTAKRLGFKWDSWKGVYCLDIRTGA